MLVSALYAMCRGLVHETFAIIAWLVAGYAAVRLTPVLMPFVAPYISQAWLQPVVVGLGTYLAIFIPLSIATRRIARSVNKSHIGAVDRVMGFVFGAGRGLVSSTSTPGFLIAPIAPRPTLNRMMKNITFQKSATLA